jgi:hypothetical protein
MLNLVVNHHVKLGLLHCMGLFDSKSVSDDEEVRGNPHPQSPTHSCESLIVVCCADDVVVRAACDNGESPLSGDGMLRIIARSL